MPQKELVQVGKFYQILTNKYHVLNTECIQLGIEIVFKAENDKIYTFDDIIWYKEIERTTTVRKVCNRCRRK